MPPPAEHLAAALADLERFLHEPTLPLLIHCGLVHAQFETIHPFIDGNGRVGRLLITLLLCERQALQLPLLYLSYYLKAHRAEYYDRLMAVRNDGNWEGWLSFFLRGIAEVSQAATGTARAILTLREEHRQLIAGQMEGSTAGLRLLDRLFEQPLLTVRLVEGQLGCSYATAAKLIESFVQLGLLRETTGWQRNRRFRYDPYLALFEPSLYRPGSAVPVTARTHYT